MRPQTFIRKSRSGERVKDERPAIARLEERARPARKLGRAARERALIALRPTRLIRMRARAEFRGRTSQKKGDQRDSARTPGKARGKHLRVPGGESWVNAGCWRGGVREFRVLSIDPKGMLLLCADMVRSAYPGELRVLAGRFGATGGPPVFAIRLRNLRRDSPVIALHDS